MYLKSLSLIMILFLITGIYAQQAEVGVRIDPIPQTTSDWECDLTLNLNIAPANGILVEMPKEIVLIPVSLEINKKQVWLQNSFSEPVRDSVVAWQKVPEGIMLFFEENLLKSSDELHIKCVGNILKTPLVKNQVNFKEIVAGSDGNKVSDQVFASGIIPSISNR